MVKCHGGGGEREKATALRLHGHWDQIMEPHSGGCVCKHARRQISSYQNQHSNWVGEGLAQRSGEGLRDRKREEQRERLRMKPNRQLSGQLHSKRHVIEARLSC